MIMWEYNSQPQNEAIKNLAQKAGDFVASFEKNTKSIYVEDSDAWEKLWAKIVDHYGAMTFDDLVMAPVKKSPKGGDLGGFGMNAEEASLLYTIGTGDGSWGAFYSIGALWFIRCTIFGFGGQDLQTVVGLSNPESLPFYGENPQDSNGKEMTTPTYKGIQSLVEYLYFCKSSKQEESLHESKDVRLFTDCGITKITKQRTGKISVDSKLVREDFDYVFVTSGQWASQMSFQFEGFSQQELPQAKITAEHTQHNISSCKLFFPLKEKYWEKSGNKIPQVIVTDTFIQDAYSLAWEECENGVILASYTWEDDSLKLLPFNEDELVEKVTAKLKQITLGTVGQDITDYIVKDKPVMIQWIKEPTYDGCAKLYRQRDEGANCIDLSYNQNYGKESSLYFTGENYSVEGGWTEPALRSALDGVMQLLHHSGAKFKVKDFKFEKDYPRWPESCQP
jgi:hypothetical protein